MHFPFNNLLEELRTFTLGIKNDEGLQRYLSMLLNNKQYVHDDCCRDLKFW